MCFIASIFGKPVAKGLIPAGSGMLVAFMGTGEEFCPRLTGGGQPLASGIPIMAANLGMPIPGEVFEGIGDLIRERGESGKLPAAVVSGDNRLPASERIRNCFPSLQIPRRSAPSGAASRGRHLALAATPGHASASADAVQARRGSVGAGVPSWLLQRRRRIRLVSERQSHPASALHREFAGNSVHSPARCAMEASEASPGPAMFVGSCAGNECGDGHCIRIGSPRWSPANLLNAADACIHEDQGIMVRIPEVGLRFLGCWW